MRHLGRSSSPSFNSQDLEAGREPHVGRSQYAAAGEKPSWAAGHRGCGGGGGRGGEQNETSPVSQDGGGGHWESAKRGGKRSSGSLAEHSALARTVSPSFLLLLSQEATTQNRTHPSFFRFLIISVFLNLHRTCFTPSLIGSLIILLCELSTTYASMDIYQISHACAIQLA